MVDLQYVELVGACVSQDVLQKFDCGHPDFNNFLADDAIECSNNGEGVTYILVDKDEYVNKKISTIFSAKPSPITLAPRVSTFALLCALV